MHLTMVLYHLPQILYNLLIAFLSALWYTLTMVKEEPHRVNQQKKGNKAMKDVTLYTTKELQHIWADIDRELANREKAAKEGEWNTVRQAVLHWVDKYGPITLHTCDGEYELDSRSFSSSHFDIIGI